MRTRIAILFMCGGLLQLPGSALAAKMSTYECKTSSSQCVITCFGSGGTAAVFKTDQGVNSATLTMLEGNSTAFELGINYASGRSDIFVGAGASQCLMTNFRSKHP
jgi:hypothetical protein